MQASRKCTFAPLAGVKAPDPYAAFGREVARPQAAERKQMANKYAICLQLNPEGMGTVGNGREVLLTERATCLHRLIMGKLAKEEPL